ncbi:MAG: hypothetical protein KY412_07660 [Actinobacteria bacterium]|nr:hypothetical protein [Actinomycetota bacterium]
MRMNRSGSLTLAALLTVSLAGCGGGGDELSKAQFVEQGNKICERTEQRITQAAERAFTAKGEIPSAQQITDFANETVDPALQEELEGLRDLTPPKDDEDRVKDILDEGQRGLEEVRRDPTSLIGERDPLENYHELASGYGLDKCGKFSEEVELGLSGRSATPTRTGAGAPEGAETTETTETTG